MKKIKAIQYAAVGSVLSALCCTPTTWAGDLGAVNAAVGELIVRLHPGASIDEVNSSIGTDIIDVIPSLNIYRLSLPSALAADQAMNALNELDSTIWVEPNLMLSTMGGTTGSFFVQVPEIEYETQYAIGRINLATTTGTHEVLVAVLDTGVDAKHERLVGKISPNGFDFIDEDDDPADIGNGLDDDGDDEIDELVGHGTHIAGLVSLVAPQAEILPVRVLNSDGIGYAFQAAQGVHHAIDNGAQVLNLSFTSSQNPEVLRTAVQRATNSQIVVIAAAGNLDQQAPQYPAGIPATIAVTSTGAEDIKSVFSNYGQHITLSAPGEAIVSTLPGNIYGMADGTSFSAGFTTGAAALLLIQDGPAPPTQVRQRLIVSSANIDDINPEHVGLLGFGRLDVGEALDTPGNTNLPGDLNNDNVVDIIDLLILLNQWGPCVMPNCPADLTNDGVVSVPDLLLLLSVWTTDSSDG